MRRKKVLFGLGLAVFLLPALAVAEQAMIEDFWNSNDLNRVGSIEKLDNDHFILRGAIPNECLNSNFQIFFNSSNGQIIIQDPMNDETIPGRQAVRECLKKARPACKRTTCTKLSDLGGRFDLTGVDTDMNLSLVVSDEKISDLPNMTHVSSSTLRKNEREKRIEELRAAEKSCTGRDRVNAAQELLRLGANTIRDVEKAREKAMDDEFRVLERAAKTAKSEDIDDALERIISFASENDAKFANRAVMACATLAGKAASEKTRDGYDKASEIFEQCENIDGISSLNAKRLKDYKIGIVYDKLALSVNNPNQFMSEMADVQRLIQEQYESACATDGGDPDMCTRLMTLNDKVETLGYRAEENAMRAQQRKMAEYEQRQMRRMNPGRMSFNGGGPSPFGQSGMSFGQNQYGYLGTQQPGLFNMGPGGNRF